MRAVGLRLHYRWRPPPSPGRPKGAPTAAVPCSLAICWMRLRIARSPQRHLPQGSAVHCEKASMGPCSASAAKRTPGWLAAAEQEQPRDRRGAWTAWPAGPPMGAAAGTPHRRTAWQGSAASRLRTALAAGGRMEGRRQHLASQLLMASTSPLPLHAKLLVSIDAALSPRLRSFWPWPAAVGLHRFWVHHKTQKAGAVRPIDGSPEGGSPAQTPRAAGCCCRAG